MFKIIIPLAAAVTLTAGTALASNPDKWDMRGADQVNKDMQQSEEFLFDNNADLGIDYSSTASTNNATTKDEVEEPTDLRRYNR